MPFGRFLSLSQARAATGIFRGLARPDPVGDFIATVLVAAFGADVLPDAFFTSFFAAVAFLVAGVFFTAEVFFTAAVFLAVVVFRVLALVRRILGSEVRAVKAAKRCRIYSV